MPWAASSSDLLGPMPFRYCTGVSMERARRGASTAEFGMVFIVYPFSCLTFSLLEDGKQKAVAAGSFQREKGYLVPVAFCLLLSGGSPCPPCLRGQTGGT